MLNKEHHQLIMGRILKDIYSDTSLAPILGFKGGTCAYLLYGLPRFSVDLDFDLLQGDASKQQAVFERLQKILTPYGEIKDSYIKRYTIFCLLSYGDADHNIKIEINTRMALADLAAQFEIKEYLGMAILAAKQSYLFAGKLAALTLRTKTAMRDIYDIWYFAKQSWDIEQVLLEVLAQKPTHEQLTACIEVIEKVKDHEILQGLGELLGEKEKAWVKQYLRTEAVFLLKNYQAALLNRL